LHPCSVLFVYCVNESSFRMKKTIFLIFPVVVILASCSAEWKLANRYAQESDKVSLMYLSADNLFADYLPTWPIEDYDSLDEYGQDSARLANSLIIKQINQNDFFATFNESFVKELRRYGVQVFTEAQMEAFQLVEGEQWMVNLAQVEIEETIMSYHDEEVLNGMLYTYDFPVNQVTFSSWFEFSPLNIPENKSQKVLFASYNVTDKYQGYFTQNFLTGEVGYFLDIDTLDMTAFKNNVSFLGRLYAGYTFDYLMNHYLKKQIPDGNRSGKYLRYDPYRRLLFSTENDRFEPLD